MITFAYKSLLVTLSIESFANTVSSIPWYVYLVAAFVIGTIISVFKDPKKKKKSDRHDF